MSNLKKFLSLSVFVVLATVNLYAPCKEGHPLCPEGDCRRSDQTDFFTGQGFHYRGNNGAQEVFARGLRDAVKDLGSCAAYRNLLAEGNEPMDPDTFKKLLNISGMTAEHSNAATRAYTNLMALRQASRDELTPESFHGATWNGFCSAVGLRNGVPKTFAAASGAMLGLLLYHLAYRLSKNPMETLANATYNPFVWLLKDHKAELIGALTEELSVLAFQTKDFIGKAKQSLAGLDKAANMRQSGFDSGSISGSRAPEEAVKTEEEPVSLLMGTASAIECYLLEINDILEGFVKGSRAHKKFARQIRLLKGLKAELQRALELIKKIKVAEDLVEHKKGGALLLCASTIESNCAVLMKSLAPSYTPKSNNSSGRSGGLYGGGLAQ